jgi:2-oxoglutarate ferredoxin oxidoreductase subunit alpha
MVSSTQEAQAPRKQVRVEPTTNARVRLCGDSGDGMQLAGTQLTNTSAVFGNDVSTLPDFPAEIRAPAGSLAGVSGFQICFSREDVHTPGDQVDALIAMNPAALRTNVADLEVGGICVINEDAFTPNNLQKAGYASNPLDDGSLSKFRVYRIPMDKLVQEALASTGIGNKAIARCKNFFALGLTYWMYGRPMENTLKWINDKFAKNPAVAEANSKALKAGYYLGETAEMFTTRYEVPKAKIAPGRYRKITGNEAVAIGMITAAQRAGATLFYGSYPITPASDILHELSMRKNFNVITFQAEDEIAAITAVIGASYTGAFAVTGTAGPGLALKSEALGLAVMTELPLVVVDVQRGGPSTGLPTKTEQADLLQAIYGRHGESPLAVIAAATPADCFDMIIEAFRIAVEYMTPVILLTDGYLANGAEPWRIPDINALPVIKPFHPTQRNGKFMPYKRDEKLARPWALPGVPGFEHRIGGLEKQDVTGNVSYDPANHQRMIDVRAAKIAGIADRLPPLKVNGPQKGDLLIVGWGSTYGAITSAVDRAQKAGKSVAHVHLRYLNPMQRELGAILKNYQRVLVPEMNKGQLLVRLRAEYLVDAKGLNKVQGKPFKITEIEKAIDLMLAGKYERLPGCLLGEEAAVAEVGG